MLVGERNAGVDQRSGEQDGARLLRGGLERELREEGGSGVVGEADEVDFLGGFVDGANDELAYARYVLFDYIARLKR